MPLGKFQWVSEPFKGISWRSRAFQWTSEGLYGVSQAFKRTSGNFRDVLGVARGVSRRFQDHKLEGIPGGIRGVPKYFMVFKIGLRGF